jgi:hypothetical protein
MGKIKHLSTLRLENLRGRCHSEDFRHRWKDNIEMNLREIGMGLWIGFV